YGVDRINAAFEHGGEALLVKTLRDYLGVRIDHFIEVNFRGFQQVVNTLGGVLIPVDGRYYNHNDGSAAHNFADIDLQPGYQRLNATQALAYARFRHYDSDVYRAARQQLFLREVMREVFASKYQFLKLERILEVFAKATASDISSLHTIWTLTTTLHSTPTDHVTRVHPRAAPGDRRLDHRRLRPQRPPRRDDVDVGADPEQADPLAPPRRPLVRPLVRVRRAAPGRMADGTDGRVPREHAPQRADVEPTARAGRVVPADLRLEHGRRQASRRGYGCRAYPDA